MTRSCDIRCLLKTVRSRRLCNGDLAFKKMCERAHWTGVVKVFVVNTTEHPDDDVSHSGCPWRNVFEDEHPCIRDVYSKIVKSGVIANIFIDAIRTDPDFKQKTMQAQI